MRHGWLALVVLAACGRDHFDPTHNVAFVTSSAEDPLTFGADLSGADAICATRAAEAGLQGRYAAYLGNHQTRPTDRLGNARGWVRTDGKPLADQIEDLAAGALFYPLRIDENGEDAGDVLVATGEPTVNGVGDCGNWQDATKMYTVGGALDSVTNWQFAAISDCTLLAHLYCFGTDFQVPLVPAPVPGRRMFLTVQGYAPSGGIASADALCAQEASLAGISGRFLAMLPTTAASPSSRFDLSGPTWVRLDGIPLAATAFDLVAGTLEASPSLTSALTFSQANVITGPLATVGQDTCGDWTGPGILKGGGSWVSDGRAFGGVSDVSCNGMSPIYCFEP